MSHQDQNNQQFEKSLKSAFQDVSQETTSDALDKSILAMAEKHHAVKLGFWDRIFRSKQMKYAVSASAALVMTVGIARFMVYLGKTDQSSAKNADILVAQQQASDDFAFEMEVYDEGIITEAETRAQEVAAERRAYSMEKKAEASRRELISEWEAREVLESPELAKVDSLGEESLSEVERTITTTGSRVRGVDIEAATPVANLAKESKAKKRASDDNSLHSAGVLDEALDDSPKPDTWLAEISDLLEKGHDSEAKEEWSQFNNTYPDFQLSETLHLKFKQKGLFD